VITPGQGDAQMQPQARGGLTGKSIMAEAGNPRKAAAAMLPCEVADWHRQGGILTSRCGRCCHSRGLITHRLATA
jgi:hypothetical protein